MRRRLVHLITHYTDTAAVLSVHSPKVDVPERLYLFPENQQVAHEKQQRVDLPRAATFPYPPRCLLQLLRAHTNGALGEALER